MKLGHVLLGVALVALASIATVYTGLHSARSERWPAPIDSGPGEQDPDFKARRKAWIESLHRHAPDLD